MEELRPLWAFFQVARLGTQSEAAHALSLSSAAISKSIAKLEKQLDMPLFSRAGRRLQLTHEGQRLYEQVEASFDTIQAALSQARHGRGVPSGTVRMSSVTVFGRSHVIPILPQFFAQFPQINVLLSLHDGARGLSRHGYDIRINWGEQPEQGKVAHRLSKMRLILVASPSYLARQGTPVTPGDLSRHDCICVRVNGRPVGPWQFTRRGNGRRGPSAVDTFLSRGRITLEDELEAVVAAAVAGLGVTIISAESVATELANGTLVALLSDYSVKGGDPALTEIILQHSSRRQMSPAACALVDFLVEHLKERSPGYAGS